MRKDENTQGMSPEDAAHDRIWRIATTGLGIPHNYCRIRRCRRDGCLGRAASFEPGGLAPCLYAIPEDLVPHLVQRCRDVEAMLVAKP